MSAYTQAVKHNLEGLTAVSTGLCPGCDTCRGQYPEDFEPQEGDDGLWVVGCIEDKTFKTEALADAASKGAFEEAWESQAVLSEPSFARGCDICGSRLAGDMDAWHAILNGEIHHWERACIDCVVFLANGDEPKDWEA